MTNAWFVRESSDGGNISVATEPGPWIHQPVAGHVYVLAAERGMGSVELRLTVGEVDELIAALTDIRAAVSQG